MARSTLTVSIDVTLMSELEQMTQDKEMKLSPLVSELLRKGIEADKHGIQCSATQLIVELHKEAEKLGLIKATTIKAPTKKQEPVQETQPTVQQEIEQNYWQSKAKELKEIYDHNSFNLEADEPTSKEQLILNKYIDTLILRSDDDSDEVLEMAERLTGILRRYNVLIEDNYMDLDDMDDIELERK